MSVPLRREGRYFRLCIAPADRTDDARLGIAVSRRVDRRAVGRNRIKRIARESFRHVRASLPANDVVLLAKPGAAAAGNGELAADLARLWRLVPGARLPPAAAAVTMPGCGLTP